MAWFDKAKEWMTPERAAAFQGIGMGLSQLDAGQPVNLSPAYEALEKRRQQTAMRKVMEVPGVMDKFTPEQQAVLASMPESLATQIIMEHAFKPEAGPVAGVNVGGSLVNPYTGEVMYAEAADAPAPYTDLAKINADLQAGLITPEQAQTAMSGMSRTDVPAAFASLDMQAQAAGYQPGTPEYQEFMRNGGGSGAPAAFIALDLQAKAAGFEPGTPGYQDFMATRGAGLIAAAKAKGEDVAQLESMDSKMEGLETVVERLGELSEGATYTYAGRARDELRKQLGMEPTDAAVARAEYIAMVDNQVLPLLRDTFGAAFTQKEGETLRATLGDPNKSPAEKQAVLTAFIEQKRRDLSALEKRTGGDADTSADAPKGGNTTSSGVQWSIE
jgi:hypothetical protein